MKIFFTASREGFKTYDSVYKRIVSILKKNGETIFEDVIENAEKQVTFGDFESRYKKIKSWISSSDALIAEISTPSTGLGHEIYQALSEKKQVLVLMDKKINKDFAATLRGNPSKNIDTAYYNDTNLEQVILNFIKNAKRRLDTKFILIISPEIDRYLEWASEARRMHKAQVVRESVEAIMKKDKEYKAYLNSQ